MHVQYKINPAANGANITVINKGKNVNIFFCIGSVIGEGFSLCCKNIVNPINIGQAPIIRNVGGSQGIKPNKLKTEVGSLADKSSIQPKKGWCLISSVT